MKNFKGNGDTITVTAPADVSAGDVYEGNDGIGVYHEDALSGESVEIWVKGEFELPADTLTLAALDGLDWNGTALIASVAHPKAGKAAAAYTAATLVRVIIG